MPPALRSKRKQVSDGECTCPICMESCTEENRVCFPCGHWICAPCDGRMLENGFLACATCRTPREGVNQSDVEAANRARTQRHVEQEGPRTLLLRAGGRQLQVLFFPDQANGANPFTSLGMPLPARNPTTDDYAVAQAVDAASVVHAVIPHLRESAGPIVRLDGPIRDLVNQLLTPGTMASFLAQREAVRSHRRTRRSARAEP